MNTQKMARIGLTMIGVSFLAIALACVVYVMMNGFSIDVGKMYKEHLTKQRLQELQKNSSGLTFLEYCGQRNLECSESIEHGKGYVARTTEVFHPFWENKAAGTGLRFGWQDSQRVFNSEQGGYRSSESFGTAGPRFIWKSVPRDVLIEDKLWDGPGLLPPAEPPPVPLDEVPTPPAK